MMQQQQLLPLNSATMPKNKAAQQARSTATVPLLASSFLLAAALLPSAVYGHGHMTSPRSRNYVAYQDGVYWPLEETNPYKETEPQSANIGGTEGRCGVISGRNYDYPLNALGGPLSPRPQACYKPGETIDLMVTLTAHHKGHFEFHGCPISPGGVATQECFDMHPLEFDREVLLTYESRSPANFDEKYPVRAYVHDGDSDLHYKYRLPSNLIGDLVLLQWHYVTANTCSHVGYDTYKWPMGWERPQHGTQCGPLPPDGRGAPEQFWNCAEVRISNDCGAPPAPLVGSLAPSANPTTRKPTTGAPTTGTPTTGVPTTSVPATTTTGPTSAASTTTPTSTPTATATLRPTSRPSLRPTSSPTTKPAEATTTTTTVAPPGDTQWYPSSDGATKCKNDGMAPSWLHHRYASQSTCCTSHFNWAWYDCMGTKPAPSNKWYIDWSISKCKLECDKADGGSCGGLVPGSWVLLHDSLDACCRAHMSYDVNSCMT